MAPDDDHPLTGKTPGTVLGGERPKLVETKMAWARAGRLLTGEAPSDPARRRLPPGQRTTRDWPVLDLGERPAVAPADWVFTVGGLVDNPIRWGWRDFLAQPQVEIRSDIHCVTQWSRYDNTWRGVAARHLLAVVRPRAGARFVVFHGHDGYTTNLPLERFDVDDALLAHAWEGEPLSREHGGPVRVVVPRLYFWKSAKWVRHMLVADRDVPGYWEARGYHAVGDPWKEERYG